MKTLHDEPSELILDRIYLNDETRKIIIGGHEGVITGGGGGWGEVAICVNFGDTQIIKRERESEDYRGLPNDGQPSRLQTYDWEREGEDGIYYITLADAMREEHHSIDST